MKHFHCYDKNIYVQAMKNKLSNFGDFAYKLNAFIFVFKTGIEQYKMNGKINATNSNFYFKI